MLTNEIVWQTYATLQITLGFVCLFFFFLNDLFVFLLIEHTRLFTTTHIIAYSLIIMGVHWLVLVGFVPNLRPTWPNRVENFHTRYWLVRELVQSGQICIGWRSICSKLSIVEKWPKTLQIRWDLCQIWRDFAGFGEILLDSVRFPPDLAEI